MIDVVGAVKTYGTVRVVDGVDLQVPRGGITSVIGPNGAGKSTLLSMVSRLLPMDGGTVTLEGLDVHRTAGDLLARRLATLRQDNHLTARLTVHDLVTFGRYPWSRGRPTVEDAAHIDQALEFLDLVPLAGRFLDELSGGQRQRAFVAMVLCQDTDYVLLDEPLNNLDLRHAAQMMRLLRRASDELGKTIVLVLHDINFAARWSDHVVAMRDGRVMHQGTPRQIIEPGVLREVYGTEIAVHLLDGSPVAVYFG